MFMPILAQSAADQPVTITFIPSQVITWVIIGLIAGYIANLLVRGRRMNPIVTIIIGVLGAFVGNILFTVLNVQVSPALETGINIRWIDLITAAIGAIIILIIFLAIFRRR
ncbi:MAG TPA: GlsB/YeaQ/YmgE family stress response membrane protein [Phototrophicaceae bacterium]|nr:GlsB/YeaQ/YmgE family stress response membrane protein [Phototrophicaceae bacterium]